MYDVKLLLGADRADLTFAARVIAEAVFEKTDQGRPVIVSLGFKEDLSAADIEKLVKTVKANLAN